MTFNNPLLFGRVITAMVSPFSADGSVDFDEAIRLGEHLIATGTDTILLAGTTGESPTLTHDEEFELFKLFVAHFKGRAKIMAGTGSNSTATAVTSTRQAERLGVDGVLQVVPYYNKPSQEGMYRHFKAVAEATSLPVLLYNIPGRTGVNMMPETIARLASVPGIIGIKEAAGSLAQMIEIKRLVPEDFVIYSGDDALTVDFMEAGAVGVVSVASQVAGSFVRAIVDAMVASNVTLARDIESKVADLFKVLFITSNPTPVKAVLRLQGFKVGVPRLPLVDVTESEYRQITEVLRRLS
jgi:4-hydroxy-tetrahydrodipicolinate synthase